MQAVRGIFLAYRVGRQPAQTVHRAPSGAALVYRSITERSLAMTLRLPSLIVAPSGRRQSPAGTGSDEIAMPQRLSASIVGRTTPASRTPGLPEALYRHRPCAVQGVQQNSRAVRWKQRQGGLDQHGPTSTGIAVHIGVRDLNTGHLVATTRLLDHTPRAASGIFTAKKNSIATSSTWYGLS